MTDASHPSRRSLALELTIVTIGLLAIAHGLFLARANPFIGQALPAIVALLLLYAPIVALWKRKRPIDYLDHGWHQYARSFVVFAAAAAIVFPPFLLAAHGWQVIVAGKSHFHAAGFPDFLKIASFQFILIALPEEFYFRGYFQSATDRIFKRRWRIFGADLGFGWIVTAAAFAIAHTIVVYQWWHFAIFFPALAFGYLRERTGSITAPILFHAASNLLMDWFARCYA